MEDVEITDGIRAGISPTLTGFDDARKSVIGDITVGAGPVPARISIGLRVGTGPSPTRI